MLSAFCSAFVDGIIDNDKELSWVFFIINIPNSGLDCKSHTPFGTQWPNLKPNFWPKLLKIHTFWGSTYLYSPCKKVSPPLPHNRVTAPVMWTNWIIPTGRRLLVLGITHRKQFDVDKFVFRPITKVRAEKWKIMVTNGIACTCLRFPYPKLFPLNQKNHCKELQLPFVKSSFNKELLNTWRPFLVSSVILCFMITSCVFSKMVEHLN